MRPSSRWTPAPRRARPSSTCSACSPSSNRQVYFDKELTDLAAGSKDFGLNKASAHAADAGKFLAWLATPAAMTIYGKAGGTPPMPAVLDALSAERPEFKLVGEYAAQYGFVVKGGTAAYAVPVYTALADAFSGYWAGQGDAASALAKATDGMNQAMQQK